MVYEFDKEIGYFVGDLIVISATQVHNIAAIKQLHHCAAKIGNRAVTWMLFFVQYVSFLIQQLGNNDISTAQKTYMYNDVP